MGMDYGKAAYLKAEDLERRFDKTVSAPKNRNAYTTVRPNFRLNTADGFEAVVLKGEGAMALIVRLCIVANHAGVVELYIDGARAGAAAFEKTGRCVEIMMNTVTVLDGGRLKLSAADGFDGIVESVEMTLIGAAADFNKTVFDWAADTDGDCSVVVTNEDGALFLRAATGGSVPTPNTEAVFIGRAVRADAAVENGVCYMVYTDASSNLWGCTYDIGKSVSGKVMLGSGADSVAIAPYLDGLVIIITEKGVMKYFTTDLSFNIRTLPAEIDSSVRAESVLLIKNSSLPSLIFFSGGKSYLKTIEKETFSSANITAAVELTVLQVT